MFSLGLAKPNSHRVANPAFFFGPCLANILAKPHELRRPLNPLSVWKTPLAALPRPPGRNQSACAGACGQDIAFGRAHGVMPSSAARLDRKGLFVDEALIAPVRTGYRRDLPREKEEIHRRNIACERSASSDLHLADFCDDIALTRPRAARS